MNEELKLKKEQNALIAGLAESVQELRQNNAYLIGSVAEDMNAVVAEQKKLKQEVIAEVHYEVSKNCAQIKSESVRAVEQAVAEEQRQIRSLCNEYEDKTRRALTQFEEVQDKLKIYTKLQKFFFWATPVLLFLQGVVTMYLLLK